MAKHIAQRGSNAGRWVNCVARQQCRNGGLHVEDEELYKVSLWKKHENGDNKYVALKTLDLTDVINYRTLPKESRVTFDEEREKQVAVLNEKRTNRPIRSRPATPEELAIVAQLEKIGPTTNLSNSERARKHYENVVRPDYELSKTKTHAITRDGFKISLKQYGYAELQKAKKATIANEQLINIWTKGAVPIKKAQEYIETIKSLDYYNNERLETVYHHAISGMVVDPSTRGSSLHYTAATALVSAVQDRASDVLYGYEIGSHKKYKEYSEYSESNKKPEPNKEVAQTSVSVPVEKEPTVFSNIKNWVKGW